jgi:hypothetical protein
VSGAALVETGALGRALHRDQQNAERRSMMVVVQDEYLGVAALGLARLLARLLNL